MPDLAKAIKLELQRLICKDLKKEVVQLRTLVAAQRREIAALKKSLATGARQSPAPSKHKVEKDVANASDSRLRFVAKGFRTNRTRLGLTAEDMGVLIGVSGATIYNWEQGKSSPRQRQLPAIAAVRGIGKKAALAKLEALKSATSKDSGRVRHIDQASHDDLTAHVEEQRPPDPPGN